MRVKLKRLPQWNVERRESASRYGRLFESATDLLTVPYEPEHAKSVYHVYVVRVCGRDQLRADLAGAGISAQIHYPTPLHLQQAYADLGYQEGDLPVAEAIAAEIISLPMYPGLTSFQQKRVVASVIESVSPSTPVGGRVGSPVGDQMSAVPPL